MKRIILSLVGLALIVATLITASYAWFINGDFIHPEVSGSSAAAYFAGGNGTKEKPYQITNKRHMYNLAWLQYLGKFNETVNGTVDQKYFVLNNDIDMKADNKEIILPPIGTEENPFLGSFDGNNNIISNLKVSNDATVITASTNPHPTLDTYALGDKVGMFGIIGDKTANLPTDSKTLVTKLYLDNCSMQATAPTVLIGLLAGYVAAGEVSTVGIHYSNIQLANSVTGLTNNEISKYTLIGDYDSSIVDWIDLPGGGVGYGTSTDIQSLFKKVGSEGVPKYNALPFRTDEKETEHPIIGDSTQTTSISVKSDLKLNIRTAPTQKASENNIGYYVGAGMKIYYSSTVRAFYDDTFYTIDSSGVPKAVTPGKEVINYLKQNNNYQYMIRMSDSEYKSDTNADYYALVPQEYGNVAGSTVSSNILLPTRSIWVAPRHAGTMKIVCFNSTGESMGFKMKKLRRSIPGNYSSYFTEEEPVFNIEATELKVDTAYYFEIEVSSDDVKNGVEYALTGGDKYKTNVSYIDLGSAGGAASNVITGVQFVYSDGTNIVKIDDQSSKIEVVFAITGIAGKEPKVILYFKRKEILGVLYFIDGAGVTVTPSGSGANSPAKNENCDESNSTT